MKTDRKFRTSDSSCCIVSYRNCGRRKLPLCPYVI